MFNLTTNQESVLVWFGMGLVAITFFYSTVIWFKNGRNAKMIVKVLSITTCICIICILYVVYQLIANPPVTAPAI